MKRYVIYSAIVGGYDEILQPLVIDERFDYVLFSNDIKDSQVGVWQIRPIPYSNPDNTRVCRYVKTHPEELLKDYEVSVWTDSNVQVLSHYLYEKVVELDKQGVAISSMWHPERKCIYEEAFAVVNMMVEHEKVVVDWCHFLRKQKYPVNNGLCETNVMYRKHNEIVRQIDELWWRCIENYSRRDQLSFNYVLWELGVPCHYFFGEGRNARNTEHMRLVMHKDIRHNHCPIGKNEAWLMRHGWKNHSETAKVETLYYKSYATPFPRLSVAVLGQYYRLLDRIKAKK